MVYFPTYFKMYKSINHSAMYVLTRVLFFPQSNLFSQTYFLHISSIKAGHMIYNLCYKKTSLEIAQNLLK